MSEDLKTNITTESQNHKMVDFGWGLWRSSGPSPCWSSAICSQLPRTVSRWLLCISKHGDFTTSLGNLHLCSFTLTLKMCLLMFRWNLLCFNWCPLPLLLPLGTTEKSLALPFLHHPFRHLYTLIRSTVSLLFSRLISPSSLSLSLQERCSCPLIIFVALHLTVSSMSMSFLYWGTQNWTQHSRCGPTSAE